MSHCLNPNETHANNFDTQKTFSFHSFLIERRVKPILLSPSLKKCVKKGKSLTTRIPFFFLFFLKIIFAIVLILEIAINGSLSFNRLQPQPILSPKHPCYIAQMEVLPYIYLCYIINNWNTTYLYIYIYIYIYMYIIKVYHK